MKALVLLSILYAILGASASATNLSVERVVFAGGCFWCMEPPYEWRVGVVSVVSGFSGGEKKNPKYKEVASGKTKHREAVQISYHPDIISYERLVEIFLSNINPQDGQGQFNDRGRQYSPAIFFSSRAHQMTANKALRILTEKKGWENLNVAVERFKTFYPAEEEHQDFYKKNIYTKAKYKLYRSKSGRDDFIEKHWGDEAFRFLTSVKYSKPAEKELKKRLTALQFRVTQKDKTETAFKNPYHDFKKTGIYVDIVSGEPLFSSTHKYDSGTGWPSFDRPIDPRYIIQKKDNGLLSERIEVRSRFGDSHLGHVFTDGPESTGLRYCMNSAALFFIPKAKMKKKGYGEYLSLFAEKNQSKSVNPVL